MGGEEPKDKEKKEEKHKDEGTTKDKEKKGKEKHGDEEKPKDKEKKAKEKNTEDEKDKPKDGEKKDKEKKKDKAEKNPDEKKKIKDPASLKAKLEKIDAKIDALKIKREEMVKQLHELEAAAGKPAEGSEAKAPGS